jgi:hypothetical protein
MLLGMKPVEPLAPYTTCTHVGRSTALVLPDGDGELLTLLVNPAETTDDKGEPKRLVVHGIAVPKRSSQKLAIRVVGGSYVEFVPASDQAKPANRLLNKNANDVTKVAVGASIHYVYDEKAPGWRQTL